MAESEVQIALSIVIPVYHEEKNIENVLAGLNEHVKISNEIVVVGDDEADPTLQIARNYGLKYKMKLRTVVNHHGNSPRAAILSGMKQVSTRFCVVFMGDGSDDPRTIDDLYFCMISSKVAPVLISASRYDKRGQKEGWYVPKAILSRLACSSLSRFANIGTSDCTNNFKLYSVDFLDELDISSEGGFELALEICVKARIRGYELDDVSTKWTERVHGTSKFRFLYWLPRYLFWYLIAMTKIPKK